MMSKIWSLISFKFQIVQKKARTSCRPSGKKWPNFQGTPPILGHPQPRILAKPPHKMDEPSSSAESTLVMDDKCVNEARSTTPIPPALPPRPDKRALLLIYIHGFKGNETSFIEFPTVWSQSTTLIRLGFPRVAALEIDKAYGSHSHLSKV